MHAVASASEAGQSDNLFSLSNYWEKHKRSFTESSELYPKGKKIKNLLQKTELIFQECSDKGKPSAFLILPEPRCAVA